MMIELVEKTESESGFCLELTCGKKSAVVGIWKSGIVTVCCLNAAHRAWRGLGKTFSSVEEALENYRSSEMKSMIRAAANEDAHKMEPVG